MSQPGDVPVSVIAHRGASTERPENTMSAFRRALELGASGIEFDVHLTSDGQAVVHHDASLARTTTGTGPIADSTLAQVRALDAGGWFDPAFEGEQVPMLAEVLTLPAEVFELEIKTWGRAVLDEVLRVVDRADVFNRVKFTGWGHLLLRQLKEERPEARIGLFSQIPQSWMDEAIFEHYVVGTAETAGFDVAHVYAGAITEPIVERIRAFGCEVHANNANDESEMLRALDAGARSISVDDVATAVRLTDSLQRAD